nr:zinc finger, CCHC-type [Tanacetum cinerariifolium]
MKKEIIKLLHAGIIYPIEDSPWLSHVYCVPKKGGMTVVTNEKSELVPTKTVTGWRVCIDYNKLNETTGTKRPHLLVPMEPTLTSICLLVFAMHQPLSRGDVFMDSRPENHGPTEGHYGTSTTSNKVFDAGFYWPTIFKEAHTLAQNCDEAEALPTNDARVVINFLKQLLSRFRIPKALVSDRGEKQFLLLHELDELRLQAYENSKTQLCIPMEACIKLVPHMGKPVNQLEYSRAFGCLMYAMTSTRPDIAYTIGNLSRFTSNPSNHHWEAIIRGFRYLKKTMNYGLFYVGFPSVIEGYSDASWITNSEDHTSTTGWVLLICGGAISWASKN